METLYLLMLGLVATVSAGLSIYYSWKATNYDGKNRLQNIRTHFGEGSFSETVKAKAGAVVYTLVAAFWALAAFGASYPLAKHFDEASPRNEPGRDQAALVVEAREEASLSAAGLLEKFPT